MTVYLELLRHGETELGGGLRGSLDDALTAAGWAQLRAAVIEGGPWDRLISSPLQRCARFAEELAAQQSLPLSLEPDLQELHFGDWEGRSTAELMQTAADDLGPSGPIPMPLPHQMANPWWRSRRGYWAQYSACRRGMPASACC